MSKKYYKLSNAEFTIFTNNLLNQANIHKTVLDFPADEIAGLTTENQKLETDLLERQALMDALEAINTSIDETRKRMNKRVDGLDDNAKKNPNVSNSLIETLGLEPKKPKGSVSAVCSPADLVVTGTSDGVNRLRWKRNGNRQGVLFVIEAKIGDSTQWVIIDVVTAAKYDHKNQTPGVKIQYRVKAKRSDEESVASNVAVVYP